jgi:hypothetical protein
LIAGSAYQLTPTEAFVLGSTFLIHDLAMSRAAYQTGGEFSGDQFRDRVAKRLAARLGKWPATHEIDSAPAEIKEEVTREIIRIRHAPQAESLPSLSWAAPGGDRIFLIEDQDLREAYGPTIGRISHSHWWSVEQVGRDLQRKLGVPAGIPNGWTVDPLKIAVLLRVADASHLDDRRAPSFLFAIRRPEGISQEHWVFQNLLFQPRVESDLLVYTGKRRFRPDEANAWWLCFGLLNVLDNELRHADALLSNSGRQRLAVRGVSNVEAPVRLSQLVEIDGWLPIDARVHVTDAARLARHLGGESLYGKFMPAVPLRELIQNASDALRARRVVQDWWSTEARVIVRLGRDLEGDWLEVDDNGIGMSAEVLSGPLIDFGQSYWGSELMLQELPGLLGKGFEPTGKYGIGFFSVFMWGAHVRVTTRRFEDRMDETRVLEFRSGVEGRPILKLAPASDRLADAGTRVRVWLKAPPGSADGFINAFRTPGRPEPKLNRLCSWLCPTLDVDLFCEEGGHKEKVLSASDWTVIKGDDLLRRIVGYDPGSDLLGVADDFRELSGASGKCAGRACIFEPSDDALTLPEEALGKFGVVTVGGLRASTLTGVAGVLIGRPVRAARDFAIPTVGSDEIERWASAQAILIHRRFINSPRELIRHSQIVRYCGGATGPLPVALGPHGWMTLEELRQWNECPAEVLLVSEANVPPFAYREPPRLRPYVLVVPRERHPVLWYGSGAQAWPESNASQPNGSLGTSLDGRSPESSVIEALAVNWSANTGDVLTASTLEPRVRFEVADYQGQPVQAVALVARRPASARENRLSGEEVGAYVRKTDVSGKGKAAKELARPVEFIQDLAAMRLDGECEHCFQDGTIENPSCDGHEATALYDQEAAANFSWVVARARAICQGD